MNKAIALGALAGVTALVLWLALRPADEVEVVDRTADAAIDPDGLDRSGPGDIDAGDDPDGPDLSLAEAAEAIVVDAGRIDATVVTGIDAIAPTDVGLELDATVVTPPDSGDLDPDGGPRIDPEAVKGAVEQAKPLVADCYAQALRRTPDLAGRLTVRFTVVQEAGEGRIRDAEVVDEGLQRPFLEMCVLDALGQMTYPAPEGEGEVVVTYPFVLQPTAPE
ncbi:MAG: AgmX/PglI C-terminal domain-containing protein [bacterium]